MPDSDPDCVSPQQSQLEEKTRPAKPKLSGHHVWECNTDKDPYKAIKSF